MKKRTGWVSNSSSSSFILACNDDLELVDVVDKYYEEILEIEGQKNIAAKILRNGKESLLYNCFQSNESLNYDNYGKYSSWQQYHDEYLETNPYSDRIYFRIGENITEKEHYERLEKELAWPNSDSVMLKKLLEKWKFAFIFNLKHGGDGPANFEEELCYALEDRETQNFEIKKLTN